jgi:hypothetical protein
MGGGIMSISIWVCLAVIVAIIAIAVVTIRKRRAQ